MFNLKKKSLIYFVISAALFLFACGLISFLSSPLLNIFKNPLALFSLLGREVRGIIFYHRNFIRNEQLQKQVDLLKQKLVTLEEISLENVRLRNLLNFKQDSHFKVVACRVIGRSADNWNSVIIADKGSNSGIKSGMTVISYLGFVGSVIETSASTSKIMLVNDPDFGISCIIQRSRQEGLISGTLGNLLIMKYLPKDADVFPSDTIVTSGLSAKFPKGITIGAVVDIGDDFSGLGRYCLVKPAVNLSAIEEVLIIVR